MIEVFGRKGEGSQEDTVVRALEGGGVVQDPKRRGATKVVIPN
jgi:hypothetical protein